MNFWANIATPLDFFVFLFALTVIFINGWTDAPNSIFSIVTSGKLKLWQGAFLSGIFNFLGVFISSFFGGQVTKTVFSLVSLSSKQDMDVVCLSCFITIVLFGFLSWAFGLPSSESHALIFSLFGAMLALGVKDNALFFQAFAIVFYLIFSCIFSFFVSFLSIKITKKISLPYGKLLPLSCAALSFMHGAQDGQKFLGILLFILVPTGNFYSAPFFLVFLVSLIMSVSTLLGGGRIINTLSKTSNSLDYHSSFCSDFGSFLTILFCSFLGMPISTGNVKSLSIISCAVAKKEKINKKMTGKVLLASVITLPICFYMGFLICKIISFLL